MFLIVIRRLGMAKCFLSSVMEISMKGKLKRGNSMEKESISMLMEIIMMESGTMTKNTALVYSKRTAISHMKVNGKMVKTQLAPFSDKTVPNFIKGLLPGKIQKI